MKVFFANIIAIDFVSKSPVWYFGLQNWLGLAQSSSDRVDFRLGCGLGPKDFRLGLGLLNTELICFLG